MEDEIVKTKVNPQATTFTDMNVWVSNPWYETFDGVLEEVQRFSSEILC